MRGCLAAALALSGIVLLLPGLCFLALNNSHSGPVNFGSTIIGVAIFLIAVAMLVTFFSRDP